MEREIKIILSLIIILFFGLLAVMFFVRDGSEKDDVITESEWRDIEKKEEQFVDSSHWHTYTSEEYAYEMKYPFKWEFNLVDGTTFYPELCAYDKYDKCVGRVSVGVYPEIDENDENIDLSGVCDNVSDGSLRYISSDVWVCEDVMSDDFARAQGYDRRYVYYFKDQRGNIFEANIMYTQGESIRTEKEMIQTIKLKAR